ncbi:MAG TPA: glycosyltransferase family A protein, partial [Bacteroidia bacterium]|nr:glycosyltransferase family A protein [Bacteroidia bacterium]
MKVPQVSVIIPAYNAARFLAETIRSVQHQTFRNWELIIVDDGSIDKTKDIAAPFLTDDRIRYVYQENAGVSSARNRGLSEARGEFIAFLDADDLWLPENLAKKVEYLESHSHVSLVHADTEEILADSSRTGFVLSGKAGDVLPDLLMWNGSVVPGIHSMLVRKSAMTETGGFDTDL